MKPDVGKESPRYAGRILCVRWDDASYHNDQAQLDEIAEGFVVDTYGLCVRESKKGLTLSMDLVRETGEQRHSSFIPWGMILKIRRYK